MPSASSQKLGTLATRSRVYIAGKDASGDWLQIALWHDRATETPVVWGWVASAYVDIDVQPPAPPSASAARLLGIHELNDKSKAVDAARLGARAVMVFEGALEAYQLARQYPDCLVMHRKYFQHAPAPREMIAQHGVDPDGHSDSRVWYRGINEFDAAGFDGSPDGIRKRAAWDLECARILRRAAPGATWVAGGFSHGTPDFTQDEVCDAIRSAYSPAYNAGLIAFDIHNYTKAAPNDPKNFTYYDPIWFERRWQFLFTKCGFDPNVRRIVSSEAGIEAGAGGFAWAGYTSSEFRAWAERYLWIQRAPMLLGGIEYESPFVASTLYQWGDTNNGSGGWAGYSLTPYIPTLAEMWR